MLELRYASHFDLLLHVLAHMRVDNASNCYDETYISHIAHVRDESSGLTQALEPLQEYYNRHFERLGFINFLPFHAESANELIQILHNFQGFTPEDRQCFVHPFAALMDRESAFYLPYWGSLHAAILDRESIEIALRTELEPYACIFAYYSKRPVAYLSYAITANGRGYNGLEGCFAALAPYPKNNSDVKLTFFTLLHEYTHQFTDPLISALIRMDDGSHDLSENTVHYVDYLLIKALSPGDLDAYRRWLTPFRQDTSEEALSAECTGIASRCQALVRTILHQKAV